MKKLLIVFCMIVGFAGMASAQAVAKKALKPTTTQVKPAAPTTTQMKPAAPTTAGPVKKDGTLDKRYSANKSAKPAPAMGPVKKDGTPDKRFKANKKN